MISPARIETFTIDEAFCGNWNDYLSYYPEQATVFQTREWMRALQDAFGYTPEVMVAIGEDGGSSYAVMPYMVESRYGFCIRMSMPFDTYGGIIGDPAYRNAMMSAFFDTNPLGAGYCVEFNRVAGIGSRVTTELLDIRPDMDTLWKKIAKKNQNAIKATTNKVTCRIAKAKDELSILTKLLKPNPKIHGEGVTPELTKSILKHMVPSGLCIPYLTFYDNEPVCASLFFHYGNVATYWAMSLTDRGRETKAHYQLVWSVIRDMKFDEHVLTMNFGATPKGVNGVSDWKKSWGTVSYSYSKTQKVSAVLKLPLAIKEMLHV
jgi:hypothetical protein